VARARVGLRPYLLVALTLSLALLGGAGYTVGGLRSFELYRRANAEYQTACDTLVSWEPPAQILTGFYPNLRRLVTVRYRSETAQTLTIAVSIPTLTQEQQVEVHAGPITQAQEYGPPLLSAAALDALVGPRRRYGRITLTVRRGGAEVCAVSAPVTLYSRQMMRWADAAGTDDSSYLAGWVTPQADVIRDLVGRTADQISQHPYDYPDARALVGYDEGRARPAAVINQVNALFDTLRQAYHLRYAQVNVPFRQDQMQVVQLPRDVLSGASPTAMCVESTVIMASAVERLGMRPYIVFTPGHVFLGVGVDSGSATNEYWETSDLNAEVSGAQANIHGDSEFADASRAGHILRVLEVQAARAQGILPIE
jgi:hypothetical protein